MKISIIIPVYNVEKFLKECLDSIVNQNYRNIEIILVDDGSCDSSGKICDEYEKKDKRIIVIHQKNCGVSNARNKGINKATGKYICFVDSDDIIHPDYIQKLVNNLNEDSLSVCLIKNFEKNVSYSDNEGELITLNVDNFIDLCTMLLLNTPCCKLYDIDIIKTNKIFFNTEISLGEDLLFNLDYLKYVDKVFIVNQELYYYRKSDNNTLSTMYNPKMQEIQYLLFDNFTDFFKKKAMSNSRIELFDSYRLTMLTMIIENEFKNKKISFWQRYKNAQNILYSEEMQRRLIDISYPKKKMRHFLLKHKMVLTYKIINKICG